jgi:hypothetical protein
MLALREIFGVVARRSGTEPGDGEIGHQTLGSVSDVRGLCEQPSKRQGAG